jgi:hypothetical protein
MKCNPFILCLFLTCLLTFPTPDVSTAASDKKFKDDKIQLEYPATWTVMQENNVVTFKNNEGTEILWVEVILAGFEEAAEEAGFIRVEKDWRLLGRHEMEGDIEEISGSNWRGLIGEAPVGMSDNDLGFVLGFATVAMVTDGVTAAILSGETMRHEEGKKVLNSVRFKTRMQGDMQDGRAVHPALKLYQ